MKARPRLDLTFEPHVELVAKNPFGCTIERMAGGQNAWQPPGFQGMQDEPLAEGRCVTTPVMLTGENPTEFNILLA